MPVASKTQHRITENTSVPYKSYTDITSDEPNYVDGRNILGTSRSVGERRPGFSDNLEVTPTSFNSSSKTLQREFKWSTWGGTFYSMVTVIDTVAKVYKYQIGSDTSYQLLFTSTSAQPFSFVVSNNTLYFGNGTDMRAWSGTGNSRKWGITKPSAIPTLTLSGAGISAFSGYYYRYTYYNSATGHESSCSDLSLCTPLITNNQVNVSVTASADTQVNQIRIYRTTDGGSTDPSEMQELSNSPFANATATYVDTTPDGSLLTRTCTGTLSNDPPTPSANLCWYGGRIFSSINSTTYFSGLEELGNGVPEECWPSGLGGNFYPWDSIVTAQAPLTDGVAVYTRGRIWKIEGDRRDNFRRYKLLEKRGTLTQDNVAALGNSHAWFDVSGQVWLSDKGEIGFDVRTDLANINQNSSSICIHIAGRFHWIVLCDGATGKLFVYDLDTDRWQVPWQLQGATTACAINSGESSAGNVQLSVAYNKDKMLYFNPTSYNDNGSTYTAYGTLNLFDMHPANVPEWLGAIQSVNVETSAKINSDVLYLLDDDPTTGTYKSLLDATLYPNNPQDPPMRLNGANLVKKLYMCSPEVPGCERASFKLMWPAEEANFILYTIDIAHFQAGT